MSIDLETHVREAFKADQWPDPEDVSEFGHVIGFIPKWGDLPDLDGEEMIAAVEGEDVELTDYAVQTQHGAVGADIRECLDSAAARRCFIDHLSHNMTPDIGPRADLSDLGDFAIADTALEPELLIFSRYNLTCCISADRGDPGLPEAVARYLDEQIRNLGRSAPSGSPAPVLTDARLEKAEAAIGERIGVGFNFEDDGPDPLSAVLRTRAGPIFRDQDGRVFLEARTLGDHPVEIVLVSEDGRLARRELSLQVVSP